MKKLVYLLTMILVLASCKKKEEKEFTPTDVTADAKITGLLRYDGTGASLSNVTVKVKIANNELYDNGADGYTYYTATTDERGAYTVNFKVNKNTGSDIEFIIPSFMKTNAELSEIFDETGMYEFAEYTNTYFIEENEVITEDLYLDYESLRADYIGNVTLTAHVGFVNGERWDMTDPMNPMFVSNDTTNYANQTFDFIFYENDIYHHETITTDANGNFTLVVPVTENGLIVPSMVANVRPFVGTFNNIDDANGNVYETLNGIWGDFKIQLTPTNFNYAGAFQLYSGQEFTFDMFLNKGEFIEESNNNNPI